MEEVNRRENKDRGGRREGKRRERSMREEKRAGGSLAVLGREIFYLRLGRVGRFSKLFGQLERRRRDEERRRESRRCKKRSESAGEIRQRND